MKFSIAAILLAATSLVSAEEFRITVGKAENGSAAVCPRGKIPARELTPLSH